MTEPRRLRLGVLCLSGLGGSGIVASDIAAGLAARGHEVHLVSDKAPFRLDEVEAPVHLHTVDLPPTPALPERPVAFALAAKLAELCQSVSLDLIHAHYSMPNAVVAQLARSALEAPPPTVLTVHGTDVVPLGIHPSLAQITRVAVMDAVHWTAPSAHLARLAERSFALPDRSVEIIPNFVDGDRFGPSRACDKEFIVIHISNFRPVKRPSDAVLAFAQLPSSMKARLLMVGDGPQRPEVQSLVRDLGLSDRVRFLGARHEVARWLERSHVAIVPSESESFGLSALEAMAAGIPVLASRVGGLPEVVTDGRTGFLVEVGDISGFGARLQELAQSKELRARLGEAGRRDALKRFRPEDALGHYEQVYYRVSEQHHG